MAAFLDTVNVASVAIILSVCFQMSKEAITDWRTILIAVLGFLAVFIFPKINTAYIIVNGALIGWLLSLIH